MNKITNLLTDCNLCYYNDEKYVSNYETILIYIYVFISILILILTLDRERWGESNASIE